MPSGSSPVSSTASGERDLPCVAAEGRRAAQQQHVEVARDGTVGAGRPPVEHPEQHEHRRRTQAGDIPEALRHVGVPLEAAFAQRDELVARGAGRNDCGSRRRLARHRAQ
jgi:hypothetical protein